MMRAKTVWLMVVALMMSSQAGAQEQWVVYEGGDGAGKGKHVVLVSGDEEYRSEEALPQLGKILSKHHGFKCTVLFPVDKDGTINPEVRNNIPGLEALASADVMVIATRFRDLPDEQMKHFVEFIEAGKPVISLRTATHAFNIAKGRTYEKWSWNNKAWDGGFGRQILGETWISHHGQHGKQATRGVFAPGAAEHPILRGIKDGEIFGPTDVYGVRLPLPGDSKPLVLGAVLEGMNESDKPIAGAKNDPMMPIAWVKTYKAPGSGKEGKAFVTTMGSSTDLSNEGMRRLLVNAVYWSTGLEVPGGANVDIVGEYSPLPFKFGGHRKGVKPADHAMK